MIEQETCWIETTHFGILAQHSNGDLKSNMTNKICGFKQETPGFFYYLIGDLSTRIGVLQKRL